jgi:hypothetical protein
MAQILKHRRGSVETIHSITANKGEIIMATGSIGSMVGPWVFIGNEDGISGSVSCKALSKIYQGTVAPSVAAYGTALDGTPYFSIDNKTLYILAQSGNSAIDLTGNINGNTITGVTITSLTGTTANITSITGSLMGTSSYALNSNTLDGRDSTEFVLTSSFNTYTGNTSTLIATKLDTSSFNIYTSSATGLINTKLDTSSFNTYTSSFNTYTGNTSTLIATKLDTSSFNIYTSSATGLINTKLDTSSFNTYTGNTSTLIATKLDTSSFNIYTSSATGLINTKLNTSSFNTYTGNTSTLIATKLDTSSFNTYTSSNDGKVTSLISKTGSYATTGSNTFKGSQIIQGTLEVTGNTTIHSNLYVSGNLEILGSASQVIMSSSTLIIDDNIIVLNAYSPFERYAGIQVMDSGSSHSSASLLWDSEKDYWFFVSSSNHTSKIIGTTPGTFGTEVSLTVNSIPKASGNNTIGDSLLVDNGTTLSYNTNKFTISSSDGATFISGSLTLSAVGGTDAGNKTSTVTFRNSTNILGFVPSTQTTDVLGGILGYRSSDGILAFSTVIDGGTY